MTAASKAIACVVPLLSESDVAPIGLADGPAFSMDRRPIDALAAEQFLDLANQTTPSANE